MQSATNVAEWEERQMNIIQALEEEQLRSDIPEFRPGDTVKVHAKIVAFRCSRVS